MAIDNFIPEVWAVSLLSNLNKAHVYTDPRCVNRDYEGEIKDKGDTVRINSIGRISISNFSKNTDLTSPETLTDAQSVLNIDQGKFFNFQVDDLDKIQGKPRAMDEAMKEAAYSLTEASDNFVAGLYTDVAVSNFIGSDASPKTGYTVANVYEYLVDLSVILDENNIPQDGRWIIVPPFMEGYLLKDARFVSAGTTQTDQVLRTGLIGRAAGFDIMKSNNVVNIANAKYKVLAGHRMAITYAEQILRVDAYRPEKRFADAVKGLYVYGAKVIRPSALACLVINRS